MESELVPTEPSQTYPYCRVVVYKAKGDDLISHPLFLCLSYRCNGVQSVPYLRDFWQSRNRLWGSVDFLDVHDMIVRAEAFEGGAVELFAVVRVGDADEEFRPFLH